MRIKVRYFTTLRELAQRAEEVVELRDGALLRDLIEKIALTYGNEARKYLYVDEVQGTVDPSVRFLINGRDAKSLKGLDTRLKDGDIVAIIPPIGGG